MAVSGEEEGFHPFGVSAVHLAYCILGGYVCVFSLVSLLIKEKLYIGEATVATIVGIIFGPVALNLFNPFTWGNTDQITLELSRIVLIVQVFAVGVELPKAYMWRHWKSLFMLLVPVMAFGWVVSSAFIYWLIPAFNFVEALCVGACVTATDPVLASSVVGKGKFAKRVPGHLRNLLSAESGSNDGMAFPFLYLALYIILDQYNAGRAIKDWILITILYEVVMGTVLGAVIGVVWRKAIKFAERKRLVDRESFLSFYFVLAIFCTGVGTLLGTDDLLVAFACGCAFAWDGWFTKKTEESHVSNVIDLLFNLSFFVYYGAIIPWDMMNAPELTVVPWRLVVIAILILLFRRIPIMLALKPIIPDIRTWREALFCGHFGPIGVGAIFISILARAELETGHTVPLATLPTDPNSPNYTVILAIWPIVSFLILSSIIVHGSSIAVFTLGKHLNTLSFTITYTQDNGTTQASAQSGATWASRLPRMSIATRRPLSKYKKGKIGPISAPQDGRPLNGDTLREGGPISLSAIGRPADVDTAPGAARRREERRHDVENVRMEGETEKEEEPSEETQEEDYEEKINDGEEAWREGDNIIVENEEGEVIRTITSPRESELKMAAEKFGKNIVDKFEGVEEKTQAQPESIAGRLKRIWSGRKESDYKDSGRQEIDLEQGITEEEENPAVVEKRSSADSAKGIPTTPSTRSPPRPAAGPTLVVDEEARRTGHVSDRTERRARQERDQETAVERRRREAVLGSSADSDDEGPPHPPYPMLSRNKGKEPESSADEEEEDSPDDEAPSSRSQSSSRGAESSASGSQLIAPPPARTRGIRFGDINVGQASFSLEEGPPSTGARHHKTGSGSGDWRVRWNK